MCKFSKSDVSGMETLPLVDLNGDDRDTFACEECPEVFRSPTLLRRHNMRNHGEDNSSFQCPKCSIDFMTSYDLIDHLQEHNWKPLSCTMCPEKFEDEAELQQHFYAHTDDTSYFHTSAETFQCDFCAESFPSRHSMMSHIKKEHTDNSRFVCSYCSRELSDLFSLRRHVRLHTGVGLVDCPVCLKKYPDRGSFNRHLKTHEAHGIPGECSQDYEHFNNFLTDVSDFDQANDHEIEEVVDFASAEKQFQYVQPSAPVSEDREKLLRQFETDEPGGNYQCVECDVTFSQQCAWDQHMAIHTAAKERAQRARRALEHPDENSVPASSCNERPNKWYCQGPDVGPQLGPHVCSECDEQFLDWHDWRQHLSVHDKAYQCKVCSWLFVGRAARIHRYSHVLRFKCERCDERFSCVSGLQKHARVHDEKLSSQTAAPDESPKSRDFYCQLCDLKFVRLDHLQRHCLTHSKEKKYACTECPMRFTAAAQLGRHVRTHNKFEPYKCAECGKVFDVRHRFQKHLLLHSNGEVFKCAECSKVYLTSAELDVHLTFFHGNFPRRQSDSGLVKKDVKPALRSNKEMNRRPKCKIPYVCTLCRKVFQRSKVLKRHLFHHLQREIMEEAERML